MFVSRSLSRFSRAYPLLAFRAQTTTAPEKSKQSSLTMKALVLPSPGPVESFQLQTLPVPPLAPGKVRVRVAACGICHRDLLDRKGAFPFMQHNTVLGHEIAGTVVATAPDVQSLMIGDRVVSLHWSSCGTCAACRKGETASCDGRNKEFLGLTAHGGYAEYCQSGARGWLVVPEGWSPEEAACVMCTYGTVWRAAVSRGRLSACETLLVTGASGGVGTAAVRLAVSLGCRVIAVTSNPSKVPYLESLGAHEVIVHTPVKPFHLHDAVKAKKGVDMVLDCVGEPTFASSIRSLRHSGRLVLVGNVTVGEVALKIGMTIIHSIEIIGSDSVSEVELAEAFSYLNRHGLRPHISEIIENLEDIPAAHTRIAEQGTQGRIVLKLQPEW